MPVLVFLFFLSFNLFALDTFSLEMLDQVKEGELKTMKLEGKKATGEARTLDKKIDVNDRKCEITLTAIQKSCDSINKGLCLTWLALPEAKAGEILVDEYGKRIWTLYETFTSLTTKRFNLDNKIVLVPHRIFGGERTLYDESTNKITSKYTVTVGVQKARIDQTHTLTLAFDDKKGLSKIAVESVEPAFKWECEGPFLVRTNSNREESPDRN